MDGEFASPAPGPKSPRSTSKNRFPQDERPSAWTRFRPWIFALFLLLMAFGMSFTTRRTIDTCSWCIALHVEDVRGFGIDPFAPWVVVARAEDVRLSDTCKDLFDGKCVHRWERYSSQGGVLFFRVFTGGTLERQPIACAYEQSEKFHARVLHLIKDGALTKEELRQACTIPAIPAPADLADPARRALLERGTILLEGWGDKGSADAWRKALDGAVPLPR